MDKLAEDKLNEVVNSVLEVYAFMYACPFDYPDDEVDQTGESCEVTIRFSGARSGELELLLPLSLAGEIANTALGTDVATESESLDAARELSNQVCGQLITELFGTEMDIVLEIPNATVADESTFQVWGERGECLGLLVEQAWPLLFRFKVQETVGN